MTTLEPSKAVITIALVIGIAARLLTALAGDNYDMESWWIASDVVSAGEPVYSATHRYNYGPLWAYIIGGLRWLSAATGPDTITRLHLFMTAFLTLPDLILAYMLSRATSWRVRVLFFLNPISCFVTGYHIQFDNLAIVLGIGSWLVLSGSSSLGAVVAAGALLGASLSMKHIFSLFLAWLPFITGIRGLKERIVYGLLALSLFVGSFLPFVSIPEARRGIEQNVLAYTSTEGHSLTSIIASISGLPARPLFMVLMVAVGALLPRARTLHRFAPHLYLIALTALSSGMARNYLAIPLAGIFTFLFARAGLAYLAMASLAFVTVNTNLGSPEVALNLLSTPLVSYELCQLILVAVFAQVYRRARDGNGE